MVFKKKYLVKNFWLYLFLLLVDFFTFFLKIFNKKKLPKNINKILISNIGHLGDVVIATAVLPILKKNYPDIFIGFLCSSDCKDLLQDHLYIDKIHTFDHFKLNRKNCLIFQKIKTHFKTYYKAQKDLLSENYDLAFELRHYYPNSILLLYYSKIAYRIGFNSAGFSNFFTQSLYYKNSENHVSAYNSMIFAKIFQTFDVNNQYKPFIAYKKSSSFLQNQYIPQSDYFIIHIGSGDENKELALHFWNKLINDQNFGSCKGCFTGKGEKEKKNVDLIIQKRPNCINLTDKVNIYDLINLLKNSKFIICVDTFVLHLATALNIKIICLFSDINNSQKWCPKNENVKLIEFNKKKMQKNEEYFEEILEKVKQEINIL